MAVSLPPSSTVPAATSITTQLPLISLCETVAKINMPAVVQASVMTSQNREIAPMPPPQETMYNLTLSNGEIHNVTTSTLSKLALPPVATFAVSRDLKNEMITTTNQKPIIVTVSGMQGMAGKQLTSVTNMLTTPLLSAPVHMIAQHFTTDKLPSTTGIVTLPRGAGNVGSPLLAAKPRPTSHITPLLPGSIITSKGLSQLPVVIASANNQPLLGSSAASVITSMSGISLSNNIVTVTPVIMTSTAPLVSLAPNSAMTLNHCTANQAQMLTTVMQPNCKTNFGAANKTLVPTFFKPVNAAATTSFPLAVQPATITVQPCLTPTREVDGNPKCDPKNPEFDPIQALEWKDGIATLPGSSIKFKLNEFGTLELLPEDLHNFAQPAYKDEVTSPAVDENQNDNKQKEPPRNKEMYQNDNADKISQNGTKDTDISEELCRCENCDCFGLKVEFCKSGRFCSQACVTSFTNKRNAWMKRGPGKDVKRRKRLKTLPEVISEIKSEETGSEESLESKKDESEPVVKGEFLWEEYLKQEDAVAAPENLFKANQTFPTLKNSFEVGMKMEAVDPKHPSLFCVVTVKEIRGFRIRVHFDGYSECYDFWVNADSPDIFPVGWCEKTGHRLQPPKGFTHQEFDWPSYLKPQNSAAPKHLFNCKESMSIVNNSFRVGTKLEAVDKKNSSLVCVATITDAMGNRFLIHFDGWEDIYDYWADPTSPYLHPVNWCEENKRALTPPKDCKDSSTFSWSKYLSDSKSLAVPPRAFRRHVPNNFEIGMKLETVDKRNPILIRVATIVDRNDHNILIHFDGWSSVYDYWVDDDSPDIHPIGWCAKTGHPLEPPVVSVSGQTGPCPTAGCLGQGHIKGPKYTTHHSAFGCPYSQLNLNKIESGGQDRVIITKESLNEMTRKISDQSGTTDGLRRCPTPGCNGSGHIKGKYSVHHRVSGCPLAERNALKGQDEAVVGNSSQNAPSCTASVNATKVSDEVEFLRARNGIGRGKNKFKLPGTGMRGRPPKAVALLRIKQAEALKKMQEASEKKPNLEEKIHDSVFNPPFQTPPKELPPNWNEHAKLLPTLESIKGSAVKNWTVKQVAKFVSSIKGCEDQVKSFCDHLIDGEAFLLLTQADMMNIMHLRMGPALKLFNSIVVFKESIKVE